MKHPVRLWTCSLLLGCATFIQAINAQEFPSQPIQITNMYAVGGGTDIVARAIGQKITEQWQAPVVVESRPGAGGTIAAAAVAKQAPDGYHLLITDVSFSIGASLYAKLSYNPLQDFAPVILLNTVSQVLVINPSVPANSVQELVAYAKENPGKILYASAGNGTPNHLAVELLKHRAGIDLIHVPYRGAVAALTDVIAGSEQLYIGSLASALPHIRNGKLRALAMMEKNRSPLLPEIPSITEAGFADFDIGAWYGMLAPAGTPARIVEKLNLGFQRALKTPEVSQTMQNLGNKIVGSTPAEFEAFLRTDIEKWKNAMQLAGVKPN